MRSYEQIDAELNNLANTLLVEHFDIIPNSLASCGELPFKSLADLKVAIENKSIIFHRHSTYVPWIAEFFTSDYEKELIYRGRAWTLFWLVLCFALSYKFSFIFLLLLVPALFSWSRSVQKAYTYAIVRTALRSEKGFSILYGLKQFMLISAVENKVWSYKGPMERVEEYANQKSKAL